MEPPHPDFASDLLEQAHLAYTRKQFAEARLMLDTLATAHPDDREAADLYARVVPLRYGDYQAARIDRRQGQADLILRDGTFYLYVTIDLPTPPTIQTEGVIGVDMGIAQVAVTDDGEAHTGEAVMQVRKRVREHRRHLQARKTRSAFKRLQKTCRRQSRFVRDTNHRISKHLVFKAVQERKALALESLSGIRERANRKSQAEFHCQHCGVMLNADENAAKNIKTRGEMSCALMFHAVAIA